MEWDYHTYTLLRPIPQEILADFLVSGAIQVRAYAKGQIIHLEGDPCVCLELVLDGKVVIDRIDETGQLFSITEFAPDDVLGGNLVFSSNPLYPMTITARSAVIIMQIPREILLDLCFSYREFFQLFLRMISDNTLILGDKIKNFVNRSIRDSVLSFLRHEYRVQKGLQISLNTTKKVLAERMGVQRTSLSRELQRMKDEGLITFDASSITIVDPSILQ